MQWTWFDKSPDEYLGTVEAYGSPVWNSVLYRSTVVAATGLYVELGADVHSMEDPYETRNDDDRGTPTLTTLFYETGKEPGFDVAGRHQWTAKVPEQVEKQVAAVFGRRSPELLPIFDVNKKLESENYL